MRVKTSELSGRALDWAVAYAKFGGESVNLRIHRGFVSLPLPLPTNIHSRVQSRMYSPSMRWTQGGPIIETELIDVFSTSNGTSWCAQTDTRVFTAYGRTPLIAAMRCYISKRLGDYVEIPDELLTA
jgi:hypothetical protein